MGHAVLLVDDERFARTLYSDYLRVSGYEVEVAEGAEAALSQLAYRRFDVLLTDVILPGSRDGLELLVAAKQLDPDVEVILITALDKVGPAVRAMKSGASDYLVKPVTPETLQLAVEKCLANRALLRENEALRAHLKLFETCQRIAATLDREKLVGMSLGAVAAECGSRAALLLEKGPAGVWTVSGATGVDPEQAVAVLEATRHELPDLAPGRALPVQLPSGACPAPAAVCFAVGDEASVGAAVAVLVDGALFPQNAEATSFLCGHLALALKNVGRLRQVENLAYIDDLTRLYNTRYLDVVLDREMAGGRPFTVLFMDLDRFKDVNDHHGHLSGSKLLVDVGRVLRSCVRDEDVLVRYGGDEYVTVLAGIDSGGGLKVAERIRRAIEDNRFLSNEGSRVRVTASIGLASFPEHARTKAEILDLADRAMYRGKRTTRNVVYMASKDLPPVPEGERS